MAGIKRKLVEIAMKVRGVLFRTKGGIALYYNSLQLFAVIIDLKERLTKSGNTCVRIAPELKPKYKLGVFVRVFNEQYAIQEFIAFHMAQGVEHFYIYNNMSQDSTVEKIQPFVDAGIVTLEHRSDKPMSPAADTHCMNTYGHECEWIACIDADEFIFTTDGTLLPDFLENYKQHPALAIHWIYYGSNGHRARPSGLVMENYTKANPQVTDLFKSVVQPRKLLRYGNSHYWFYRNWQQGVDENHQPVRGPKSEGRTIKQIRLNHYVAKSFEDYMAKAAPGYGVDKQGQLANARTAERAEKEMIKHNDVVDESILGHVERTKAILNSIIKAQPSNPE